MLVKCTLLTAILLCTFACADEAKPGPTLSAADRTMGFLFDPFDPPLGNSIARADAKDSLLRRFGNPAKIVSETALDNDDPTVTAEYLAWHFDGMIIHLKGNVDQDRRWITKLEISENHANLGHGLGVGLNRRQFEEKLVPALFNSDPNSLRVSSVNLDTVISNSPDVNSSATLMVEFDTEGNATKLTWTYHID